MSDSDQAMGPMVTMTLPDGKEVELTREQQLLISKLSHRILNSPTPLEFTNEEFRGGLSGLKKIGNPEKHAYNGIVQFSVEEVKAVEKYVETLERELINS